MSVTISGSDNLVLQVVSATYATQTASSSSTYADTGLTATITPKFNTSKILVLVSQNGLYKDTNSTGVNVKLLRTSTDLLVFSAQSANTSSGATNIVGSATASYSDSPATTSATTYKTQFASSGNNAQAIVQVFSAVSTITLMEIAG